MESSWTGDWTHISCIGRLILHQWDTRKVQIILFLLSCVSTCFFFIFCLISLLTHWFFSNILFKFHVFFNRFVCLFVFYSFFLCNWFQEKILDMRSEKMLDMILISLNLPRLDLWPKILSLVEYVTCAHEKKYILLLSDGMSYKYQFSPSGLMCHKDLYFLINFLSGWSVR